jgi:hypothetical protein
MKRIARPLFFFVLALALTGAARDAAAQYRAAYPVHDPATGETYHVELGVTFWNPTPNIVISSEALGIIGSQIDAVKDLGLTKKGFPEIRLVLRPAKKHKFRFNYTPISYSAESTLTRNITFNGIKYTIGLPVNSSLNWKTYRIGYEYDFIYRDRGFFGVILEAKYTDIQVDLNSPLPGTAGYAKARAPIPAIGAIARVYPVPNISITGEVTGFKLPESINKDYKAHYVDFDVYGTVNITDHFGAQVGYRSLDVGYTVKLDSGTVKLQGPYVAGVVRF